jgi:hypothetical protein
MPGPFIFIATNRLRDGRFGAEQQRVPGLSRFIEANEPRLIAFTRPARRRLPPPPRTAPKNLAHERRFCPNDRSPTGEQPPPTHRGGC